MDLVRCPIEVNLDWTAEVSVFLIRIFLETYSHNVKLCFCVKHILENYLWNYVFLKNVVF